MNFHTSFFPFKTFIHFSLYIMFNVIERYRRFAEFFYSRLCQIKTSLDFFSFFFLPLSSTVLRFTIGSLLHATYHLTAKTRMFPGQA